MPCYTRTTVKTEIEREGRDLERLQEAARELGYRMTVKAGGKLELVNTRNRYAKADVAALTRQYAALTVKAGMKRFGWQVQSEEHQGEQIEMLVVRR